MLNTNDLENAVSQLVAMFPTTDQDTLKDSIKWVVAFVERKLRQGEILSADLIEAGFINWLSVGQEFYRQYKSDPDFRHEFSQQVITAS